MNVRDFSRAKKVRGATKGSIAPLLVVISLGVASQSLAQTNCTSPPSGIAGWWPEQGNTLDAVGGNNGTLVATGIVSFVPGVVGLALDFDGTHRDRVDLGNPASLQLQDFTIEAWVKRADFLITSRDILGLDGSVAGEGGLVLSYGRNGYGLGLLNDGRLILSKIDVDGVTSSNLVADLAWHHIAVTKSSTTAVFYIDGQPEPVPGPYSTTYTFDTSVSIGSRGDARGGSFYGTIDEPTIYSRALSGNEIAAIYVAGTAGKCRSPIGVVIASQPADQTVYAGDPASFGVIAMGDAPITYQWQFNGAPIAGQSTDFLQLTHAQATNAGSYSVIVSNAAGAVVSSNGILAVYPMPPCAPAASGIISWWQAESNANDSVSGNNGTLSGSTVIGPVRVGNGFFIGAFGSVVLGSPPNLQLQDFTIEAWVKRSDTNVAGFGIHPDGLFFSYGSQGYGFGMWNDGRLFLSKIDVDNVSINNGVTDTNWHHVAVTKSNVTVVFYIDGASYPAPDYNNTFTFSTFVSIGDRVDSGDSFYGSIDELAVYGRALGASEVQAIYNAQNAGKCHIPVAPTIAVQPTNQTVYVGSNATFNVSAGGDLPLNYQWLFNGASLGGKTLSTLTIVSAQFSNAGSYSVVVSNAGGTVTSSNAILSVIPLPPCSPPASGLVSWWRGEGNLNDNWGLNNGGTPSRPISYTAGKVGLAFNFANSYIPVADSPSLRATNGLTIEAWVYPTALGGSANTILTRFSPLGSPVTNNSYYFGLTNSGRLCLRVSAAGTSAMTLVAPQPLPLNQWTLVAAAYDGASLRLYTNATVVAQTNYSGGIFPGTESLYLGATPFVTTNSFTFYWSGYLDEVSVYNRGLSDSELLSIYNADIIGKCQELPVIVAQPQTQSIPQGEDVKFTVSAVGTQPLRYQWRFNATNIIAATNSALVIEKVQSANLGDYRVVITNALGVVTSAVANIILLPPPVCTPAPSGIISWWPANGFLDDIIGSNNIPVSFPLFGAIFTTGKIGQGFAVDNNLEVPSSASLNFGSNADFSIEAWVKAFPPATNFPQTPLELVIANKHIVPPSGGPGYVFSLRQGLLAFGMSSTPTTTNIPTFVSPGPDLRDSMFHLLGVTVNRGATNGGVLYVDGQPVLVFNPTGQRGSLSNTSAFQIAGTGGTGFFGSLGIGVVDELSIYGRALSSTEILAIRQAGAAGKCIPPPNILVQPTNTVGVVGGLALLRVSAAGYPALHFQWLKNGTTSVGSNSAGLTFSPVHISDAGTYSVTISNIGGSVVSASAVLSIDRPPVAATINAATKQDQSLAIPAEKILALCSDPDGDPLALYPGVNVSTNGGSIIVSSNGIVYTPPAGYIGPDSFTYAVVDPSGGSGSGTVLVQVRPADGASGNMLAPVPVSNGVLVTFLGIPGRVYTLQRGDSAGGPWSDIASVTVDASGLGSFNDTDAPPTSAFYRTTYP
jgi:hypothetical protein